MGVWDFIQDQVLGMRWLNKLIGMGLSALGLDVNGRIGGSVQFFIYDILLSHIFKVIFRQNEANVF